MQHDDPDDRPPCLFCGERINLPRVFNPVICELCMTALAKP